MATAETMVDGQGEVGGVADFIQRHPVLSFGIALGGVLWLIGVFDRRAPPRERRYEPRPRQGPRRRTTRVPVRPRPRGRGRQSTSDVPAPTTKRRRSR